MDTTIRPTDRARRGHHACATLLVLTSLMAPAAGAGAAGPTPGGKAAPVRPARPAPAAPAAAAPKPAAATSAPTDSARDSREGLRGGQEGTVFRSLTVQGEDRVHIEFDRPAIEVKLDPGKAPGLDWGGAQDVLDRTVPDAGAPLLATSSAGSSPYLARPWLDGFGSGAVATFRPAMDGVERWKLMVADSRGGTVVTFQGKGDPPREIAWDGRASDGTPVTPGLTYSYVFEAFDRAGNKRNIVGQGFTVGAYRLETPAGPLLTFSGARLARTAASPAAARTAPATPDAVLECASWINQSARVTQPLRVTATARTRDQADALSAELVRSLGPLVIGGPSRLQAQSVVQPDAPQDGVLTVAAAK